MTHTNKRSATDWGGIEREFRAGQLSVSEIGRRYGVTEGAVRKRARRDGWSRDLTSQVREAVRTKLAQGDGTSGTSESTTPQRVRTDAEIVDQASDRGVAVIELHRADIAQLGEAKRIMMRRLLTYLRGEAVDGPFMGEKESPADLLEKLSLVEQRFITLGRQAYNLDDTKDGALDFVRIVTEAVTMKGPVDPVEAMES